MSFPPTFAAVQTEEDFEASSNTLLIESSHSKVSRRTDESHHSNARIFAENYEASSIKFLFEPNHKEASSRSLIFERSHHSTVNRRAADLEASFDTFLFEKSHHSGVSLFEEGEAEEEDRFDDSLPHIQNKKSSTTSKQQQQQQQQRPQIGKRTQSTVMRLSRQGLQTDPHKIHAVRSIPQEHWAELLRPFVADLAFRSILQTNKRLSFRSYNCQAALLFVDLSGYSKITAAIAHLGAHAISETVNEYFARLVAIVHEHGGDVVKFAGDAVMVVWEGDEQSLELNVLCAARAALELQVSASHHPVQGTELTFQIHSGLCCGNLESDIVEAPSHTNMQRYYHALGGDTMIEIGDLVDLGKAGELCISYNCYSFLGRRGVYRDVPDNTGDKILEELSLDRELEEMMDDHIQEIKKERSLLRKRSTPYIEEDFIHSSVLEDLRHGGLSPTQIAQMRDLCVFFIAMTSDGDSVNWLTEVQTILEKNRCPIVQIIDDDKGVHVVAAINLYEAVPETSLLGLTVCRELADKRVGAAVGMALGPTFCGVTGSDRACRWDITGPSVVRAARLMQYALKSKVEFAIDQSVYDDAMAASCMTILNPSVTVKGTLDPIPVFTVSDSKQHSAFRIMDNVAGGIHSDAVQKIQNHIAGRRRCAVLVTGIPLAGKKIACQRAAGYSDMIPYIHHSTVSGGFLQLARTIATWFQYANNREVRKMARAIFEDMDKNRWSYAHDQCVTLVNHALKKGFGACIIVDRIQFLDRFSLSLIRECLQTTVFRRTSSRLVHRADRSESVDSEENEAKAKICFLCVHVPLYSWKSAKDVVADITRLHTSFNVPIVKVGEASRTELCTLFRDMFDMEVEDRLLDTYAEASGYCAGYFIERMVAIRNLSSELSRERRSGLTEVSEELVLFIPKGLIRLNKNLTVTQVRTEIAMRFSQIYDELPPLCQMILKILTVASRNTLFRLPQKILWAVMNDLIAKGVEHESLVSLLEEMVDLCLLKTDNEDGASETRISIAIPALADIAMDVCTPVQVRSIAYALIDRLESASVGDFNVTLVVADLRLLLDRKDEVIAHLWFQAYQNFCLEANSWSKSAASKWKETLEEQISSAGYDPTTVLGADFCVAGTPRKIAPGHLTMLKAYSAPVSLGPIGHTFSVICRNTFHEFGAFHGANQEDVNKLRSSTSSACGRYMIEMSVLEHFLSEHGLKAPQKELETEFNMISTLANPAESDEQVEAKAVVILEEMIPRYVEPRLNRLCKLVHKLKNGTDLPEVIVNTEKAIHQAYGALQADDKCRTDAGQDALMILATMNWKPKPIPEYLPLLYYQTVANLRTKTLKRLSEREFLMYRYQHTVDDLEAFLIVTALLNEAQSSY